VASDSDLSGIRASRRPTVSTLGAQLALENTSQRAIVICAIIPYISDIGFRPDDLAHLSRLWRVRLVTSSPEHRSIAATAESSQHYSWKGNLMQIGVVKWFNSNKGFGFIQPEAGGPDVFVHVSAIERAGLPALVEGQKVGYELLVDKRSGKFSADSLELRN
jgi:CspA family cold shock protein